MWVIRILYTLPGSGGEGSLIAGNAGPELWAPEARVLVDGGILLNRGPGIRPQDRYPSPAESRAGH